MRRAIRTGSAAVLIIGIGACGGDDDDADGVGESGNAIETVATSYNFAPDSWTVAAGEEFTITVRNEASIGHDWAVLELGEEIESEEELTPGRILSQVGTVSGGESTEEAFTIEEPGTYQVVCTLRGHFDSGMEGSLAVE